MFTEEFELRVANGTFKLCGVRYKASGARVPARRRMLWWPGWLDNAGSMETIAPYFANAGFEFVVIDPPGCGKSDHRPPSSWYRDFDEMCMIVQAADALGWREPFILCGHSRGGNICCMTAGAFSDRFSALMAFDSAIGFSGTWVSNLLKPPALDDCLQQDNRNLARQAKVFNSFEDAVQHNIKNPLFPKSRETGTNIVKRHVAPYDNDGRYVFTHDTRTYGQLQPLHAVEKFNVDCLKSIKCPTYLFAAKGGIVASSLDSGGVEKFKKSRFMKRFLGFDGANEAITSFYEAVQTRIKSIDNLTLTFVQGGHHFHSDIPRAATDHAIPWLLKVTDPSYMAPTQLVPPPAPVSYSFSEKLLQTTSFVNKLPRLSPACKSSPSGQFPSQEISVEVRGLKVSGVLWGNPTAHQRIMLWPDLHDNASSFHWLAPRLLEGISSSDWCAFAIDPPGLGRSDWLPQCEVYGLFEEAGWAVWIAEAMDWSSFHMAGHGHGGEVACVVAGSDVGCLESALILDSEIFRREDDTEFPGRVRQYYLETQVPKKKTPQRFQAAVNRRHSNQSDPLSLENSSLLVARNGSSQGEAYLDSCDSRKFIPPHHSPARQRIKDSLMRIRCPVLFVEADKGLLHPLDKLSAVELLDDERSGLRKEQTVKQELCQQALESIPGYKAGAVVRVSVDGYHHVHMDDVDKVAVPYMEFLSKLFVDDAGNPTSKL